MSDQIVINGDSLEVLKDFPENSVDAVVTDPPYGLKFMGKTWDYDVPSVEIWKEVLRVLKPGGHLLSFGGTRTYHRMVVAIEDAGFEIRDQIQWLYGSGFPKSHDVSKAIDKAAGAEREVVGTKEGMTNLGSLHDDNWKAEGKILSVTAPATPDAKRWQGWGTALKPANEPIVLARKPLSESTIAENVLKYGTGGLNIDASRVAMSQDDPNLRLNSPNHQFKKDESGFALHSGNGTRATQDLGFHNSQGRFPANIIFDEDAARLLDEQSGVLKNGGGNARCVKGGGFDRQSPIANPTKFAGDSGGASRFFYVAKASKRERGDGNVHPTVKPIKLMQYLIKLITPPNGVVLDPFMGSGSTGVACKQSGFGFIGIELNQEYVEIAEKRIAG